LTQLQPQKRKRKRDAAQLFLSCLEAGTQVSLVTISHPSARTAAPPGLPLGVKDLLKEDVRLFDGETF
jgi:hypothetical protein